MTLADCEAIRQDPKLAKSLEVLTNFFTWRCGDSDVAFGLNEYVGEIVCVAEGKRSEDDNWIEDYRDGMINMYDNGLLDDFRESKSDK